MRVGHRCEVDVDVQRGAAERGLREQGADHDVGDDRRIEQRRGQFGELEHGGTQTDRFERHLCSLMQRALDGH